MSNRRKIAIIGLGAVIAWLLAIAIARAVAKSGIAL